MHMNLLSFLAVAASAWAQKPWANNSMGFIGCYMADDTAEGYVTNGGTRMWGPYGTRDLVVQSWTDSNSTAWQKFDQQVALYGRPEAVWVQICVFEDPGATYDEVKLLIANAREHALPGASIFITGQPFYNNNHTCPLSGANGPKMTDDLARQAAGDASQRVTYPGRFVLYNQDVADYCHANGGGKRTLGEQALSFFEDID
ncbi:hypothetical protein KVR01_013290 [Diaporthe batatas]|uniref:uncharacterized protein n=1 Tax=Diaporthe batatas TaxID=748121 RepID=UPI001D043E53|nr:uncharacterized protein KVR01_013290 [Diaporthe batatas]KAG8156877.1 hypothetical protein KVR01_013290 [Diaporthe batatas]